MTGVARSGTTALGNLLNAHPEVCIGIERYKFRFLREGVAGRDYFEKERFFRFLPDDTNLLPRDGNRWHEFYAAMEHKFADARVVGDKVRLAPMIGLLLDSYPGARFIYIVRSVERVASSWEVRFNNPKDRTWGRKRDSQAAVKAWNEENARALSLAARVSGRLLVVSYERLFAEASDLERLTRFLGVSRSPELAEAHAVLMGQYEREIRSKPIAIPEGRIEALRRDADIDSYRRLLVLAEAG